jgi:hypothetical protein
MTGNHFIFDTGFFLREHSPSTTSEPAAQWRNFDNLQENARATRQVPRGTCRQN